jgi:4-hydroxybenzoate polyprenyltransferase
MTRRTKIRIRKTVEFMRTLFLILALLGIAFAVASADGYSLKFPIVCALIGVVCFGISYALDCLLFETAWSGDKSSPFTH